MLFSIFGTTRATGPRILEAVLVSGRRAHAAACVRVGRALPALIALVTCTACGARTSLGDPTRSDSPSTPLPSNVLLVTNPDPNGICFIDAAMSPPDPVYLLLGSQPMTCAETQVPRIDCTTVTAGVPFTWEVCIALRTPLVPTTIAFQTYGPNTQEVSIEPDCATMTTSYFELGTLDITAVDASSMRFTLSGTNLARPGGEITTDGVYDAPRCP